jgi:hypothetical protein
MKIEKLAAPRKCHIYYALFLIILGVSSCQSSKQSTQSINEKPEPDGWFTGDIHVHRSCNLSNPISENELLERMATNDLDIISVLADIGNSQAPDRIEDLQKVDGNDSPLSSKNRIIRYTSEWHWDANEWTQPHQAIGGHLVLLGLSESHKIWEESAYKVLEWAKKQDAISGFAHMQYLTDSIPEELNCCIPIDYPVESAFGTIDFISEDCEGSDAALNAYYKLLNCGFRIGLAAGTDYPCNGGDPFGANLTFVKINDGQLTYRKWIEGIKAGNTVISRNGHKEFLDLKVNGSFSPGDEIQIKDSGTVNIDAKWTSSIQLSGRIEIIYNGKVIATQTGTADKNLPLHLETKQLFEHSGWLCARRMGNNGHATHTAAVYIDINNQSVRASVEDAEYFISWIDNILKNIAPGGLWNRYYTQDLALVEKRYKEARDIYEKIASEAAKIKKI